jgi:hypothetical protein
VDERPIGLGETTASPMIIVGGPFRAFRLDLGIRRRMVKIFDALFGCWHRRMSFPMTSRRQKQRSQAASQTATYIVCLDCGKEFAYDWQKMRVLSPRKQQVYVHSRMEAEAS